MPPISRRITRYVPTLPKTGSEGLLYRLKNLFVRGPEGARYLECYSGSEDLGESLTAGSLSGIIQIAQVGADGLRKLVGVGTFFTTELRVGQFILLHASTTPELYLALIDRVVSDTEAWVAERLPASGAPNCFGKTVPCLFEIGRKRGTLNFGNAHEFDRGHILGAGSGTLRINGAALPGSGLTFSNRKPRLALYNATSGSYTQYPLGFLTPAAPAVTAVTGASQKSMPRGVYGVVIVPARHQTRGYNQGSVRRTVTLNTGELVHIVLPDMDVTTGQSAWDIYVTASAGDAEAGPYFFYRRFTDIEIGSAGTAVDIEWTDAEVSSNRTLSYDNDPPPDCSYVAVIGGFAVYVSCAGAGDTAPGPAISPAKPGNIEAAPARFLTPLSPPELILGVVSGNEVLYLLTASSLQIARPTGLDAAPLATRPFWRAGFRHQYQLILVDGTLYGYTTAGPTRSVAQGDRGAEEKAWAADTSEIMRDWTHAHVFVCHDPLNDAVLFFHARDAKNASGYWTTRVLCYGLRERAWTGDIVLESSARDMIVTGAATVNGFCEFVAGGNDSATPSAFTFRTYRFDTALSTSVSGFVAWAFSDEGEEARDKIVRSLQVIARTVGSSAGIHGALAGEDISTAALEAGNTVSKSGAIALADSAQVARSPLKQLNVRNLAVWTPRVDFTWSGTGARFRLDEVVCQVEVEGARR